MKVNLFNVTIFLGCFILFLLSLWNILKNSKKNRILHYFYAFLMTSALVIIMVLMFDFKIVKLYPWIVIFFLPFQYLTPIYFTAFICYYLKKEHIYHKNRVYLFIPFITFFALYTLLKVNVVLEYPWITRKVVTIIHTEIDENSALVFSIIISIWNYLIIRRYENAMGSYSFLQVKESTKWIKGLVFTFIVFNVLWLLTVILFFIRPDISGHFPYYPYWILYIIFYFTFLYHGNKHIHKINEEQSLENQQVQNAIEKFRIAGLHQIFAEEELKYIYQNPTEVTGILSYFATSLFDKNNMDDVLWDICENCIGQLQLEDCVIYYINANQMLIQKAAFGNKNDGERKILSPIQIPIGKGIVGNVALTGKYECINDVSKDGRYIMDDQTRRSELAVPIYLNQKIFGVLDSEHSQKDFFKEKDIQLFQLIAKLLEKKLTQLNTKNTSHITNDNVYFKELTFLMKEAKIYRDSNLSLERISKKLNISSNYLSQLVNKLSGGNFSDYVNSFRIEDAKHKLKDPKFTQYTIISIGLESGFNSKSTFYTAFKKHTGVSPKQYRQTP
ncbi:helix-turn-helix domain-containing protein [Aquimarina algicola]|uniref:Helix-turn-helix domain-containing protein n=1 Tax=Aquimarina algicola TaxID=2589995 RepID=A0A504JAP7_9FLAO|nr:helix-turn-helix domain-containing protein [Aquimarina algicola]